LIRYTASFVMRRILLCLMGVLCACSHEPEWQPLRMQRVFDPNAEPKVVGSIISMDSPHVDNYILRGVITREPGASWRWSNPKAELRFALSGTEGVKFVADFVIADETFKVTGPVVMTFTVDGKVMGSARYDRPGEKHYETLVDGKLLRTDETMLVAAEVDKFFESQQDGVKLGFLLIRMGFTQ
jgi:hypothetical protein